MTRVSPPSVLASPCVLKVPRKPPDGLTCICFCVSVPPSDRRRYEAGTGLRVPWRRVELQTLCFRPHTSHTLHAGGGDDQLVVVRMSVFFFSSFFSHLFNPRVFTSDTAS